MFFQSASCRVKSLFLATNVIRSGAYTQSKCYLKRPPLNTSQLTTGRRVGALAMKVGMMPVFDKWGERHPTTVLHVDNCHVVQVKSMETNGYTALQLGVGEKKKKRVKSSEAGHFRKANVQPMRLLQEFRVSEDALLTAGTQIQALHFVPGQKVDVSAVSKGKGFQGVMKRWNFSGGAASHGNSLSHRVLGSTGCRQDPGRVFKNKKMPGRMGGDNVTVQSLQVLKIEPERQLLYIRGSVPGNNGTFVRIVDAVKGPYFPSPPPFPTFAMRDQVDIARLSEVYVKSTEIDSGIRSEPENPIS